MQRLTPISFSILQEGYPRKFLKKDLTAGMTVAILSLPASLAFAIAAGVRPEQGLFAAIIAGFIIALFGGSKFQVSGPTGSFAILIYATLQSHGFQGLSIATLLAGLILITLGLCKLGGIIKYIPYPVIMGYTSGMALLLFLGQLKDLFGITTRSFPSDCLGRLSYLIQNIDQMHLEPLYIGLLSLGILTILPKFVKAIPAPLVAVVVATLISQLFDMNVETIGGRFQELPVGFPLFYLPPLDWELIREMISPAISIALLAGIESLLSAVVADGMKGTRHRSDMELIALGLGNIGSTLFMGIPVTGTLSRTTVGIRSGAETPLASMSHSIFLLLMALFFSNWILMIPLATLAALLVTIAYNMCNFRHLTNLFYHPPQDVAVFLATFLLTLVVGLVTAIQIGVTLSGFLFIQQLVQTSQGRYLRESLQKDLEEEKKEQINDLQDLPNGIEVFEIQGPFFFAATEKFKMALHQVNRIPKILILRLRQVPFIDATGMRTLEDVLIQTRKQGTILLLSGVSKGLLKVFHQTGFKETLGANCIFPNIQETLKTAYALLNINEVREKADTSPPPTLLKSKESTLEEGEGEY